MADDTTRVIRVQSQVSQLLTHIEQAQAIAASVTQELSALGGGAAATAGVDWATQTITAQQFYDALASLANALPGILGAHATNLYRVKS